MSETLDDALDQAAHDPAQVSVDGMSVTAQDPSKLIELDRYKTAKQAAASRRLPITVRRIRPPGAV